MDASIWTSDLYGSDHAMLLLILDEQELFESHTIAKPKQQSGSFTKDATTQYWESFASKSDD